MSKFSAINKAGLGPLAFWRCQYIHNQKINEVIRKDKTTEIEFIADKKGTFTFSCSVPCGSGHLNMKGTLIVE